MTKLTRLLIAAILLLPSVALAQFDPTTHPNILYYVPSQANKPLQYWDGIAGTGTNPSTNGAVVGTIDTGIAGPITFNAGTTGVRPTLKTVTGGVAIGGGSGLALRSTSTSYANTIHQNRKVYVIIVFEMDASIGIATRPVFDNTNIATATATNSPGLTAGCIAQSLNQPVGGVTNTVANNSSMRIRIKNNATMQDGVRTASGVVQALDLITEEGISETTPTRRVFQGYITPDDLCWAQVDNGRKSYGLVGSAAGSGNAPFGMYFLNRASLGGVHFPGKVISAGIYSDYPGEEYVDEWLDEYPLGNIVGSPEIRIGNFHCNLNKTNTYIPYCYWFNKKRVSPMSASGGEDGEGFVFNDGVNGGYFNDGWRGGPHLSETVTSTSISVDGGASASIANGTVYSGSKIVFNRQTETGISFYGDETHTWTSNAHRTNIILTRRNDGRTINPLYMCRTAIEFDYQEYIAFADDGTILEQDDLSTTTNSVTAGALPSIVGSNTNARNTIAVAQWSPLAGQMILSTMTKGFELQHEFIIIDDVYNRRLYNRVYDSTTNGQTLEMELLVKYFDTTEEEWEALAARELGKILNPSQNNNGIGIGIGIGLGSMERKNPAQKLAAAFNHEFSVAP
jgi:hypothetical protein